MNRVIPIVVRESMPLLYYRHVTQPQILYSSIGAFPFTYFQRQSHQQNSLFLASLSFERQISFLSRTKKKIYGFISDSTKVKVAGCLAFEKIADNIDYNEFFQCFELPDTFQSWFLSIQLHVWMTILTVISEKHGKSFRNSLVDSLWHDVELRLNELAQMKSSVKKAYLKEIVMQFQASLIAYDEGILSDDTVLAGAAWRMLFACRPVDPQLLENAVLYIRKQLSHLDSQNTQNIILRGSVSFLPLSSILSDDKEM